jgi:NAD(P)H-dependent FMN reductase
LSGCHALFSSDIIAAPLAVGRMQASVRAGASLNHGVCVEKRWTTVSAIALFGSSRRHGNTGQLLDHIAGGLGIEVVDLAGLRMSPYDYEHRNRDDDFEPLMRRVLGFDQIIVASPVYWYSVSPPLKIFLDRISDFLDIPELLSEGRRLRGKTGYIVCTSVYEHAPAPFVGALRDTFEYLGMRFGGMVHVDCREGYSRSDHESDVTAFARLISAPRDVEPVA